MKREEQDWVFTWGFGQGHDNCYIVIHGTFASARDRMVELYGNKWGFQYPDKESAGVDRFHLEEIKEGEVTEHWVERRINETYAMAWEDGIKKGWLLEVSQSEDEDEIRYLLSNYRPALRLCHFFKAWKLRQ